ncbi:MAG: sugar phosphate isomerase/epimerase [Clostridia bacterium]|nr:sugar phosphate isomerase/epimerase [Clostridia bacterium]
MYRQLLALSVNEQFGVDTKTQIKMFKEAGFDGFFTPWKKGDPIEKYAAYARKIGMIYQSIHAPFGKSAIMWHGKDSEADPAVEELIECVKVCEKNGIPIMVCHTYIGFDDDRKPNEIGLERYGRVVREAEKRNVKIAFENTEGEEYLTALMEHFKESPNVGFCLDTGHEMCYNFSKDLLALYGDRLIATHINDNLGISDFDGHIFWTDDLHLLPFDGIGNWEGLAKRLDEHGYNGIMTFELNTKSKPDRHENDKYEEMPLELYLAEAYSRACRLAAKRKINMKNGNC